MAQQTAKAFVADHLVGPQRRMVLFVGCLDQSQGLVVQALVRPDAVVELLNIRPL
jgi:hypothetical protein